MALLLLSPSLPEHCCSDQVDLEGALCSSSRDASDKTGVAVHLPEIPFDGREQRSDDPPGIYSEADRPGTGQLRGHLQDQERPESDAVSDDFFAKSSLDELPQFFNVLRGEMSLVGPRPPIPYEFENYSLWHRRRILDARPGLTGIWQVCGRSRTTFDEMVRMDLRYIRRTISLARRKDSLQNATRRFSRRWRLLNHSSIRSARDRPGFCDSKFHNNKVNP